MPAVATKIKPITGMLKRGIVVDISSALGLGVSFGYLWWYGFHVPSVRTRDRFYAKLEDERVAAMGKIPSDD